MEKREDRIFPELDSKNAFYLEKHSWYRYAFYIWTSSLFVIIFWFLLGMQIVNGTISSRMGMISILGAILSPLIPLLYYLRYSRSGYAVTDESVYKKEGFLFQTTRKIPLSKINKVELTKGQSALQGKMGHVQLDLQGEEHYCFLLDARDPGRLAKEIRKRIK